MNRTFIYRDDADEAVRAFKGMPVGQLRISAHVVFGVHCLTDAMAEYLSRYPEVSVELDLQDRQIDRLI